MRSIGSSGQTLSFDLRTLLPNANIVGFLPPSIFVLVDISEELPKTHQLKEITYIHALIRDLQFHSIEPYMRSMSPASEHYTLPCNKGQPFHKKKIGLTGSHSHR